jgi:hypothetical protein
VVQKQRPMGEGSGAGGGGAAAASALSSKVRRGDICHAVVVRTRKNYQRKDGRAISFGDNACVLINKAGDPIGSRINGKYCCFFSFFFLRDMGSFFLAKHICRSGWSRVATERVVKDSFTCYCACVNGYRTQGNCQYIVQHHIIEQFSVCVYHSNLLDSKIFGGKKLSFPPKHIIR